MLADIVRTSGPQTGCRKNRATKKTGQKTHPVMDISNFGGLPPPPFLRQRLRRQNHSYKVKSGSLTSSKPMRGHAKPEGAEKHRARDRGRHEPLTRIPSNVERLNLYSDPQTIWMRRVKITENEGIHYINKIMTRINGVQYTKTLAGIHSVMRLRIHSIR